MKHIYIIGLLFLLSITASSCKKFVEVAPPKNQLATNNIFNDNGTANSAIFAIYSQMVSGNASPYTIPFTTGITGDELTNNISLTLDIYTNSIDPVNSTANSIWTSAYNFIYQANAIFEGCSSSTLLDPDVKKQLMAEAMFIRAYWHFYLVNLYGDIPLATSTDYTKNSLAVRTPSNLVYDQIITDLKYAQANLNEKYIAADGITQNEERARPNSSTATALLSRVYLYVGKYSDAEAQANTIINNTSLYSLVPLDAVFLKNSSEAIWQLMPVNNSLINTIEGNNFIPENSTPVIEGKPTLSPQLLNSFEGGDLRRSHWIGQFIDTSVIPNVNYYYPYKYKIRFGSGYAEYSMIFRLSEQYLIRAEARNEQNNIIGAISDLNIIRTRARGFSTPDVPNPLPDYTVLTSKEALKAAILQERRVELFTEQGHRWFDLKRTGEVNGVMTVVTPLKGGTWSNNMDLWPIPQSELLNDPKLTQNQGY